MSVDGARVAYPLFQMGDGGSSPTSTLHPKDFTFEPCPRKFAAEMNERWHSRVPIVEWGLIKYAFQAQANGICYCVALWSNPIARMLPNDWLELKRMAGSPEWPKNASSRFLAWMIRYIRDNYQQHPVLISYQDTAVHVGTIYKATGWKKARATSEGDSWNKPARWRPDGNGTDVTAAVKIRWQIELKRKETF